MNCRKTCLVLFGILAIPFAWISTHASAQDAASPIRVLILTGRNNHDWKQTTPMLQQVLEKSGKFRVDTTVPPRGLTEENLQNYDVILSNWNSWGSGSKEAEAAWTDETRQAYLDFVRAGKGHVTVHAGGSSFYDGWPEYRRVALVYWDLGTTGHGRPHEFQVHFDCHNVGETGHNRTSGERHGRETGHNIGFDQPDHAITTGLAKFTIRDELWNKPGVVQGATILASAYSDKRNEPKGTDQWEPSVVVGKYGKGRCFATLLGHDATTMENAGFQQLLIRGVQWAATGQ